MHLFIHDSPDDLQPRAAVAETLSNEAAIEVVKVLTGFVAVHQ